MGKGQGVVICQTFVYLCAKHSVHTDEVVVAHMLAAMYSQFFEVHQACAGCELHDSNVLESVEQGCDPVQDLSGCADIH